MRRLDWPECQNARDVGGLATTDGARIRSGALIRSDCLDQLTPEGIRAVRGDGVRRVIDLRTSDEVAARPNPFAGDPIYRWAPFIEEPVRPYPLDMPLSEVYRAGVDRNARRVTAAMAMLADAPGGGVVVHCVAGKDRTGTIVALALRVAGVPIEEIVADYAYSGECLAAISAAELDGIVDPADRTLLEEQWSCRPETMRRMLDHIDERYGGVENYLLGNGFGRVQLHALRARLRDD